MPGRTRTRTDTGFGGFAPNPLFRSVDLPPLGEYDAPTIPQPSLTVFPGGGRTSGTHTVPRTPTFNSSPRVTDPSGAGLTPSGLTGNTLRSFPNERWQPDVSGGAFADLTGPSGSAEGATPTIASGGGRSPPLISDPNDDWIGDPSRTARSDGLPSEPGMGDEPALFADQEPNQPPTDTEWTTSPGDRRFLSEPSAGPVQRDYMANFGGDMTLGQLLNTPLAMMNFGGSRYQQPVGSGRIDYANVSAYTPGSGPGSGPGTSEMEAPSAEAEARGREESIALGIPVSPEVRAAQPATNPASRFGNINSPTGPAAYFDGRNWRPISGAPSDIRWSPDNPNNSNYAVSRFNMSPDFQDWGHGMNDPAKPLNAPEEGRFLINDEGSPQMQGQIYGDRAGAFRMSQKSGSPPPYSDPASVAASNAWLMKQPEYIAWMKARKARSG